MELHCKFKMKMFPKSKKGGVVTDVVQGTGGLIIGVVIILVITSTLLTANLFADNKRTTSVINETTSTVVNESGITFGSSTLQGAICTINEVFNASSGDQINSGNWTQTNCNLVYSASDSTFVNNSLWNISSTTTFDGLGKVASDNMESNFTKGLDNISEKLPTILLIAAVVLLFGVLVILVARSRQMGIGGGTSL